MALQIPKPLALEWENYEQKGIAVVHPLDLQCWAGTLCAFISYVQEETDEERGRRIASQWTQDPDAAAVQVSQESRGAQAPLTLCPILAPDVRFMSVRSDFCVSLGTCAFLIGSLPQTQMNECSGTGEAMEQWPGLGGYLPPFCDTQAQAL